MAARIGRLTVAPNLSEPARDLFARGPDIEVQGQPSPQLLEGKWDLVSVRPYPVQHTATTPAARKPSKQPHESIH